MLLLMDDILDYDGAVYVVDTDDVANGVDEWILMVVMLLMLILIMAILRTPMVLPYVVDVANVDGVADPDVSRSADPAFLVTARSRF